MELVSRLGRLQRDRSRARLRFRQGTHDDAHVHASARHHRHRRRDRQAVGHGAGAAGGSARRHAGRDSRGGRAAARLAARARARVQGAHLERRREGVQAARRQGSSRQRAPDLHAEPGVHGDGGGRVVHLSARGPHAGPGPRRDPAVRADRRRDRPLRLREQGDVLVRASRGARAPSDAHRRARLHDAVQRDEEPLREHAHGRGHGAVPRAHGAHDDAREGRHPRRRIRCARRARR